MTPDLYLVLPLGAVCVALGLNALVGLLTAIGSAFRRRAATPSPSPEG